MRGEKEGLLHAERESLVQAPANGDNVIADLRLLPLAAHLASPSPQTKTGRAQFKLPDQQERITSQYKCFQRAFGILSIYDCGIYPHN